VDRCIFVDNSRFGIKVKIEFGIALTKKQVVFGIALTTFSELHSQNFGIALTEK
jgi:hypothetical protein